MLTRTPPRPDRRIADGTAPIGSSSTRLITLRGNSGSGKSTVAAAIRAARPDGTVAILGQDVIRRQIIGTGSDAEGHPVGLIDLAARYLLGRGLDVIIEGLLRADWYSETLVQLVADHRGVSRSYIYDLPFEETLRRHATKTVANVFGEDDMRKWWRGFHPIVDLDEIAITANDTLPATVARIVDDCWPSCA
ncbi:MAG TPA: AAA family ATPase [Mycobacteriales bacterium]|nr:AAA family ATPase [Mycobacteriales bacterium]